MNLLHDYVNKKLAAERETNQDLATRMNVTLSALLRGLKAGTLSTENCLKLAELYGDDPGHILRLSAKHETANLLERLYGRGDQVRLTAQQRGVLELLEKLPTTATGYLIEFLDNFAGAGEHQAARNRKKAG